MPTARSSAARATPRTASVGSTAPRSRTASPGVNRGFAPRPVRARGPLSRIRWDRAARAGLLVALALIGYLWLSGLTTLMHAHAQAEHGLSEVRRLAATHRRLDAEERSLRQTATMLDQARSLGMVKQGEQSFIVTP